MVGRRHDYKLIIEQLLNGLTVIPIVGMPGIGKTTLASSVYDDSSVALHFDVRVWITMSGEHSTRQMLFDLLSTLPEADEIKMRSTPNELLAEQIYRCLKRNRYLIVLDNLWNDQIWNFPQDRNGSRILLTTTHFNQGYYACSSSTYFHYMTLLNPTESWDLFCNTILLKPLHKFERINNSVVEKCQGLAHSIVLVARRLSKCENIQQEWKKVEKELELIGVLDSKALTLRYNQMPHYLKVCFLYFGVFPKYSAIQVKQLIRLWIAEGFMKPFEHKGLENQGYEYLQEFIDTSLILIDNRSSDGKIKTCRMHSALHSFCVREALKESIFCAVNTKQHPYGSFNMFADSCRWLSLYKHSFDYYVLFRTNNPRSVFFFVEIFVRFKLLRVLAFAPSSFFQRVPTDLGHLVFLRYLSVKEWFEGLDYIVSSNRNLQTLVVSSNNESHSQLGSPTLHLPCTIWESPQLQHLELDNSYAIDPPRVVKGNMQSLSWACPTQCRMDVYRSFPNIKKLKLFVSYRSPIILDSLKYLEHLERLTISVSFSCTVTLNPKP